MEYGISDPCEDAILRYKLKGKQDSSDPFHEKGPFQDTDNKFDHSGKCIQPVRLLDRDPSFHGDPLAQHQVKRRDTCNDPQTSDLDQYHKYDLSRHSELVRRDDRHKSGHAYAGHRSKERVNKLDRLLVAERKPEEHAPQKDHSKKSKCNELHCIQTHAPCTFFLLFHMKLFLLFILSCGHADQACGRRSHFQFNISLSIWIDKRSGCKERAKELSPKNYFSISSITH